jgi:hypothetical protein
MNGSEKFALQVDDNDDWKQYVDQVVFYVSNCTILHTRDTRLYSRIRASYVWVFFDKKKVMGQQIQQYEQNDHLSPQTIEYTHIQKRSRHMGLEIHMFFNLACVNPVRRRCTPQPRKLVIVLQGLRWFWKGGALYKNVYFYLVQDFVFLHTCQCSGRMVATHTCTVSASPLHNVRTKVVISIPACGVVYLIDFYVIKLDISEVFSGFLHTQAIGWYLYIHMEVGKLSFHVNTHILNTSFKWLFPHQ